ENKEFEQKRERFYQQLCEFQEKAEELIDKGEMTYKEYYQIENSMQKNLISLDRQVQAKRRMMADIEKENVMTIASSIRSIPKIKKLRKKENGFTSSFASFRKRRRS